MTSDGWDGMKWKDGWMDTSAFLLLFLSVVLLVFSPSFWDIAHMYRYRYFQFLVWLFSPSWKRILNSARMSFG